MSARVYGVKRLGWFRWEITRRVSDSAWVVSYGRTRWGTLRKARALANGRAPNA